MRSGFSALEGLRLCVHARQSSPQDHRQCRSKRVAPNSETLDSTDDGLRRLLERLWPRREQVRQLLRETGWKAMFGTTVTITEARPVYELSGDTIQRLAFFEAEYTLDVFDFSE